MAFPTADAALAAYNTALNDPNATQDRVNAVFGVYITGIAGDAAAHLNGKAAVYEGGGKGDIPEWHELMRLDRIPVSGCGGQREALSSKGTASAHVSELGARLDQDDRD